MQFLGRGHKLALSRRMAALHVRTNGEEHMAIPHGNEFHLSILFIKLGFVY